MPKYRLTKDAEDIVNRVAGHKISYDANGYITLSRHLVSLVIKRLQEDLDGAKRALEKDGHDWMPVRHAQWERWTGFTCFTGKLYRCPECGGVFVLDQKKYRYCPNCGTKMDGKVEDDE